MKINRNNYEAFFLDYFEKTLHPEEVAELMVFLEANPDLNSEFEAFEPVTLDMEVISFGSKRSLKKKEYKGSGSINAYNYEEWMVSGVEGELSDEEILALKEFIRINPEARIEYEVFRKTRLTPDNVYYESKNELKRKGLYLLYRTGTYSALAIAATVMIFLAVYLRVGDREVQPDRANSNFKPAIESIQADTKAVEEIIEIPARTQFSETLKTVPETAVDMNGRITDAGSAPTTMARIDFNRILPGNSGDGLLSIQYKVVPGTIPDEVIALNPVEDQNQSFVLRFFRGSVNRILGNRSGSQKSFIEYTVNGYNLIADREVEVEKEYDASGKIVAYHINGELIKIGRKVNPPGID